MRLVNVVRQVNCLDTIQECSWLDSVHDLVKIFGGRSWILWMSSGIVHQPRVTFERELDYQWGMTEWVSYTFWELLKDFEWFEVLWGQSVKVNHVRIHCELHTSILGRLQSLWSIRFIERRSIFEFCEVNHVVNQCQRHTELHCDVLM